MANEDKDIPQNNPGNNSGNTGDTGGKRDVSPPKNNVESGRRQDEAEIKAARDASKANGASKSKNAVNPIKNPKEALKQQAVKKAKDVGMSSKAAQKAAQIAEKAAKVWKATVSVYHNLVVAVKVLLATAKVWIPVLIVVTVAFVIIVSGLALHQTWGRDDPIDTCSDLNASLGSNLTEGDYGGSDELVIPGEYQSFLSATAKRHNLPLELLAAQIQHESNWDTNAVSWVGAQGLAQFMPATWSAYGQGDPTNPQASIEAQGRYMAEMRDIFEPHADNDDHLYQMMLAGYNAGPGAVQNANYDLEVLFNTGDPNDVNSYAGQTAPYVEKIITTAGGNLTVTERGTAGCFESGLPGSPEGMTCGDTGHKEAEERLNPNALLGWRCVLEAFPAFQDAADQNMMFSLCRPGDPLDHGQGNAIDFMVDSGVDIPGGGVLRWNNHPDPVVAAYNDDFDQATMDYGYSLVDWFIEYNEYFELNYLIFNDGIWHNSSGFEERPYNSYPGGGGIPRSDYNYRHINHVHASFEGPSNRCRGGW